MSELTYERLLKSKQNFDLNMVGIFTLIKVLGNGGLDEDAVIDIADELEDYMISVEKYGVAFDKIRGKLHTIKCYSIGDDVFDKRLYFLNEDVAEKSIRDYRGDWLTYLGVKEKNDDNS